MTDHLQAARLEFRARRYSYAVQFAQYALACDPDDVEALTILGMSHLHLSEFACGVETLEHLSLLRPLDDACRIELAIAYGCCGKKQLSRDLLMMLATSGRMDASQLLRIATGLESIEEPYLAMEACRQAGKHAPESPDVHYQMGYYAQICGHPSSVSEALIRHAIGLDPHNLHFRIGLASLLIRLGRKSEAIRVIDHFVPDRLAEVTCVCCLHRIANLFFDCDDLERAKMCAARAASLQDDQADAIEAASKEKVIS